MRQRGLLIVFGILLAGVRATPALDQKAMAQKPEEAYIEYLKAVHGGDESAVDAFLSPDALEQLRPLPPGARIRAIDGLRMVGLSEPPRVLEVEGSGDEVVLHVSAPVDGMRAITGLVGGQPERRTGTVSMSRRDTGWTIISEAWTSRDGGPPWSGLVAPGLFPEALLGKPAYWAIDDIRTVLAAESAFQSANGGWYAPLPCLNQPSSCLPGYPKEGPAFLKGDLLATAGGFSRRFDAGPRAPADQVGPGKASRSSIESFAYWVIPEDDSAPSRCGEASGVICEMPDASAPLTRGKCPHNCTPLR
jgi:hypothetical protein